jgi:hypothetical protein
MRAQYDGTVVTALLTGDAGGDLPEVPIGLRGFPAERLRVVDGAVRDGASFQTFFVDELGRLQAAQLVSSWPGFACMWSDRAVREGEVWRIETPAEVLARYKERLCEAVDADAERERLRYVTRGSGQAGVYVLKEEEARRFKVMVDGGLTPDPAEFPILSASVGIEAATIGEVADLVSATAAQWRLLAAAIEGARLGTKKLINEAPDATAALAARQAVVWPGG